MKSSTQEKGSQRLIFLLLGYEKEYGQEGAQARDEFERERLAQMN